MIIAANYVSISDSELRALIHCAQFTIEQVSGQAVYRNEPLPKPSVTTVANALRAVEAIKRELPRR